MHGVSIGRLLECADTAEHPRTQAARAGKDHRNEAVGRGSVFLRQHDRHDTRGHVLVRRVGRAVVEITIVTINLPEDRLAGVLEAAEIVLAVRVVVGGEGDEAMNAPHDLHLLLSDGARTNDLRRASDGDIGNEQIWQAYELGEEKAADMKGALADALAK